MAKGLFVVVGLGVTGFSCIKYLLQKECTVAVTDSRPTPPNLPEFKQSFPDVPLHLGSLDRDLLQCAETIVLSPGVPLSAPEIKEQIEQGKKIIGDIELFAQAVNVPVIAITGTNAKSTVTTLVGLMAKAAGFHTQVGGNLGIPALELINPLSNLYVLELSSFQLETLHSLKPAVATVLNISPDHMDRYPDLESYHRAKLKIYENCDIAVYNRDDPYTISPEVKTNQRYAFTLSRPQHQEFGLLKEGKESFLTYEDTPLLPVSALPIHGKHYQANALAALAIGYSFGLPIEPMLKVLQEFKGLPHRCQLIRELNRVRWYDDSKGTNVGATVAAIEGLGSDIEGKLILIAGGLGKNADFSSLVPAISQYVRIAILIGTAANEIAAVINQKVPVLFANSMEEAVNQAKTHAQAKDCVLLSPACASYDMFKNFEHRGQVFTELVTAL